MKRKLVQQGPSTLMVSLPRAWVKQHNLKKGDEVDIEASGEQLVFGGAKEPFSETKLHIDTKQLPLDEDKYPSRYITRTLIINALRKGHKRVTLTFDSPSLLTRISEYVDEVVGYEITEQSSNRCVIETVVNLADVSEEKYFIKFKHSIQHFSALVSSTIVDNQDTFEEIKVTFSMIEKNYNTFCRFLMHTSKEKTREKIFRFTAVEHMYQATRNLYYAAQLHEKMNKKLSPKGKAYARRVFTYIGAVVTFIEKKDTSSVAMLALEKNQLTYHEINTLLASGSKENALLLQLCFVSRRMWDAVGPYVGSIL